MARYETRWYVTTDPAEAQRLASIDHTPAEEIKAALNAEPLHVANTWSYWSDGRIITRTGVNLPQVSCLTKDAAHLISSAAGADDGHVDGGWRRLTQVEQIINTRELAVGPSRGSYARPTTEQLTVRWLGGTESCLFTYSVGYFEGYAFRVYDSMKNLLEDIK